MTAIEFPALHQVAFIQQAIDNHGHPLLRAESWNELALEGIISEAEGDALLHGAPHTLACLRATKQLARLYGLDEATTTWEDVKVFRESLAYEELCNLCFDQAGIACILMDDGLGGKDSIGENYKWHDKFTPKRTRRIVKIENVAEQILIEAFGKFSNPDAPQLMEYFERHFLSKLRESSVDSEVVAFKSIVCYRTGLAVTLTENNEEKMKALKEMWEVYHETGKSRLEHKSLNDQVVRMVLAVASDCGKPVQFHTGLGDNDITLSLSSPALLQPIIKAFPNATIVLLHASYPHMREAGYLTSVYRNVYFDFGEVFPMVSADGQREIIRQVLELSPTNKIMWSSDGHWMPETYFLASVQAREALYEVLGDSVRRKHLSEEEGARIIWQALYSNAAKLYRL